MRIAVVGASNNPDKYGYRIVVHLRAEGHTVFPINPREDSIIGIPAYRKVGDVPSMIDIVNIVVPPHVTMKVLRHVQDLGRMNIWLQPGAESPEVLAYIERHKDEFGKVVYNECIMTSLDNLWS